MKNQAEAPRYINRFLKTLLYITLVVVNICAGALLLFFQFTEYSLRGILGLLPAPLVVAIHLLTIGGVILALRRSPQLRKHLWFIGGPMLPSLVSGTAAIGFFLAAGLGITLAQGCGRLAYEVASPDGTRIARLYSGLAPAGFGECNYVYIYYEDFPAVRRDVYAYGESINLNTDFPMRWIDDKTLVLDWDGTVIDLQKDVGDLPLWLLFTLSPIAGLIY